MSEPISRRDFIKVGVLALGGLAASKGLIDVVDTETKKVFQPEFVHGIEVYGAKERINSLLDVRALYKHFDDDFSVKNNIVISNKTEQRKQLLKPDERYLEVVVRRSAYDSFQKKESETNEDFVKWVQKTVAFSNICMRNAHPSSEMRSILKRIIILEDKVLKKTWNEELYRKGEGEALDWAWRMRFQSIFPIDIDESWAIADDYRNITGLSWWKVSQTSDGIVATGKFKSDVEETFKFPIEVDVQDLFNGTAIDMGLPHEWSHYLLSLPDEYAQDVDDQNKFAFSKYLFDTGSYMTPYFSAYLSYLTKGNIERRVRNLNFFNSDQPKDITVTFDSNLPLSEVQTEIRRVRLLKDSVYHEKSIPLEPDKSENGNVITFDESLFNQNSNAWLISRVYKNGINKHVLLPVSCLNICKIAGNDTVNFNIKFIADIPPTQTVQRVVPKDKSEIETFMNEIQKNNWTPYALMEVPGTTITFIWYLTD